MFIFWRCCKLFLFETFWSCDFDSCLPGNFCINHKQESFCLLWFVDLLFPFLASLHLLEKKRWWKWPSCLVIDVSFESILTLSIMLTVCFHWWPLSDWGNSYLLIVSWFFSWVYWNFLKCFFLYQLILFFFFSFRLSVWWIILIFKFWTSLSPFHQTWSCCIVQFYIFGLILLSFFWEGILLRYSFEILVNSL